MQIIQASVRDIPEGLCPDGCVLTIGNFDGVHRGHRQLIREAARLADTLAAPLLILTFPPRASADAANLYTEEQKLRLLQEAAPSAKILELDFDEDLRTMPEAVFFQKILVEKLAARGIAVGMNFRYGYLAQGTVESLRSHCTDAGIDCLVLEGVTYQAEDGSTQVVSSTLIRALLAEGKVREAGYLLSHPYTMEGTVQHGKRLGRTMGFPTVNLLQGEGMADLRHGVYVTCVDTGNGCFYGVTNVGLNPTVEHGHRIKIETHILDFDGDLYGKTITVAFLQFLRPEQRFSGIEALKEQLEQDKCRARAWLHDFEGNLRGEET